ncbi:MAG: hypothetical protein J5I90_06450 [Caldilineales bacterium]|nr:hypothetical protein [Caldilineales bacterium]
MSEPTPNLHLEYLQLLRKAAAKEAQRAQYVANRLTMLTTQIDLLASELQADQEARRREQEAQTPPA